MAMMTMDINAEIYKALSVIAEDESLLKKAAKALKKLAAQKCDETLMSKEEFYAVVDKSLEEAKAGKTKTISTRHELSAFLNSI